MASFLCGFMMTLCATLMILVTRTQIAVLICLALENDLECQTGIKVNYEEMLKVVIPDDTEASENWRAKIISQLQEWDARSHFNFGAEPKRRSSWIASKT